MSEDRCICCGEIVPEGRMVCPNCEKQKPMKNLSHGEMVQIAEERKDLVKVVRCKDCEWAEPYRTDSGDVYIACGEFGVSALSDNDYCSFGERKEKNDAEEIH